MDDEKTVETLVHVLNMYEELLGEMASFALVLQDRTLELSRSYENAMQHTTAYIRNRSGR